jgi:hypothetical protein
MYRMLILNMTIIIFNMRQQEINTIINTYTESDQGPGRTKLLLSLVLVLLLFVLLLVLFVFLNDLN